MKIYLILLIVLPIVISSSQLISTNTGKSYYFVSIFELLGEDAQKVSTYLIDDDSPIYAMFACFLTGVLLGWSITEIIEFCR